MKTLYETGDRVRLVVDPADPRISRMSEEMKEILKTSRNRVFKVSGRSMLLSVSKHDSAEFEFAYQLEETGLNYWSEDLLEPAVPLKISLAIPEEFAEDYKKDRFEDALHRLAADAHLAAGRYEKEVAAMLIEAFAGSKPAPASKGKTIYTNDRAAGILEPIENLLCEYGVKIPSPEDDEREPDNKAPFYGSTYDDLLDGVEGSLIDMLDDAGVTDYVSDEFSGDF